MKKISFGIAICIFVLFPLFQPAQANTWKSPSYPYTDDLVVGNCTLVDTLAEADDTHVYTLNPDNTTQLNRAYYEHWDRNARCDELQFHVDHNTPISRLTTWLDETTYGWFANIGTSHYKDQTVSTSRHEWFFINESGAHRIPDWLTALSWGLLIDDRMSIYQTDAFYKYVTIGAPLQFAEGQFADKINAVWKDEVRDYGNLPARLGEEIKDWTLPERNSYMNAFESCEFDLGRRGFNPHDNLLDWSWMLSNPGCPLAD
jgi:hypothetical protein